MTAVALITGASRGLGHALALDLAATHHIVAVGRTVGALEELDDAIRARGGEATLAPMDVTEPAAMQALARAIHDRWGRLDLWCHTAIHAGPMSPAAHLAEKDFDKSVAVNIKATQRLIGYLAPLLGTAGRAVFFDDPRAGQKFFGHYGATKAGQIALARSWAGESRRTGPQVVILSPRPMPTAVRARFFPGEDRAALIPCADEAARLRPDILGQAPTA
jgi:NAD(P)-dependent dehydrogenase (short-subunit alcohol dehydrogenase family)